MTPLQIIDSLKLTKKDIKVITKILPWFEEWLVELRDAEKARKACKTALRKQFLKFAKDVGPLPTSVLAVGGDFLDEVIAERAAKIRKRGASSGASRRKKPSPSRPSPPKATRSR